MLDQYSVCVPGCERVLQDNCAGFSWSRALRLFLWGNKLDPISAYWCFYCLLVQRRCKGKYGHYLWEPDLCPKFYAALRASEHKRVLERGGVGGGG